MCRTNKIYGLSLVCADLSQFSDPEGQRFESSRSHQEQHLMGCCSFCFAWILWSSKRRDSNAHAPRFASREAETPRWGVSRARLGESLRARQKDVAKSVVVAFLFVISLKTATYVARFSRRRILKTKKRCVQRAHLFGINKYPQLVVKHLQVS